MASNAEEPLLEAEEVSPAREVSERTVRRPTGVGLFPRAPSSELGLSSRRPGCEISRHHSL